MKITKKRFLLILLISLWFAIFFIHIYDCENRLKFTDYHLKTDEIKSTVKIAFISDLHHKEFGKNNINLVTAISEKEPDLIAVGGDMVTAGDTTHNVVIKLLKQLTKIAPTYYVLGNHELGYINLKKLKKDISKTGTTILDNSMQKLKIPHKNETITIGGLTNYPFYDTYAPDFENEDRYFLDEFIEHSKNNYSILLAHQPECYIWKLNEMDLDLIISGHTHGGIIQIPFIGGVYAPNQGLFPEYDKGYFSSDTAQMIITSGLGNTTFVPRLNNQPEICIIQVN